MPDLDERIGAGPMRTWFLPCTTWNTRDGDWQARCRCWKEMGIASELGRDDKLTYAIPETLADGSVATNVKKGSSVFSPVVCELAYEWWCPPGGLVLDPFAGGSVRGLVAAVRDLRYYGIDLRPEQVAANEAQLANGDWGPGSCRWVCGDSFALVGKAPMADFLFSCPPYGNKEKYSDDPTDLSNMPYSAFAQRYADIIEIACSRLRNNRFACFVVGNYRENGFMRDLVGDTVRAFEKVGCRFYNDIILINCIGSAAMRGNGCFDRGHRKMVRLHQNVLVFVKGDPAKAANAIKQATIQRPKGQATA